MDVTVRAIQPSALRHGITEERILQAISRCPALLFVANPFDPTDDLALLLGRDSNHVPIEIVARELADGSLIVFHAMPMRRAYRILHRDLEGW